MQLCDISEKKDYRKRKETVVARFRGRGQGAVTAKGLLADELMHAFVKKKNCMRADF